MPAFAQKQKSAVTGRVATDGAFHWHCSAMDGGGGGGGWEEGAGGGGGGGSALHAFESKLYMGGKRGLFALETKLILSLSKNF